MCYQHEHWPLACQAAPTPMESLGVARARGHVRVTPWGGASMGAATVCCARSSVAACQQRRSAGCGSRDERTGNLARSRAPASICTGSQPCRPSFSKRLVRRATVPASSAVCSTGKLKQKPTTGGVQDAPAGNLRRRRLLRHAGFFTRFGMQPCRFFVPMPSGLYCAIVNGCYVQGRHQSWIASSSWGRRTSAGAQSAIF